jgi:hypothetical protein
MLDEETVQSLERPWEEGWNAEDLETIMAPFAEGVLFSSPFIGRLSGDPARTSIEGKGPLRDYVDAALRRTPGIRYALDATYVGSDSVILLYRCWLPDGSEKAGADSMRVNPDGQVIEWCCHCSAPSLSP